MTGEGDGRCNFHQLSARRLARQRRPAARSAGPAFGRKRIAAAPARASASSIWALPTTARRFDGSADADIAKAKQLDASAGRGGSGENDTGWDASSDDHL